MTRAVLWYGMEGSIRQKVDENKRLRHQRALVSLHHLFVCMIHVGVCMNHLIPDSIQVSHLRSLSGIMRIHCLATFICEDLRFLKCSERASILISYHSRKNSAEYYLSDYFTVKAGFHGYPHPTAASRLVVVP